MMELSIIVVNWKSVDFVLDCIESIHKTTRDVGYEIIVVDNASGDDCCRIVSQAHPSVVVVGSERNIGFARANNLGAEKSKGEYLLFLNPDTVVLGEALKTMVARMRCTEHLGALGCRLLNRDLSLQTSCVQAFPNLTNQILGVEWLRKRSPRLPLWGMRALYASVHQDVFDVDAVSGACIMLRRDVFEQVGGFSTEYFMYAEEIDLCCKVRQAGWRVGYVPDAQIVHFGGESSKKQRDVFADIVMRDSVFKFMKKFRGATYAWLYRAALLGSAMLRLVLLAPLLLFPGKNRSHVRGMCKKWYKIGAWSLAQERWIADLGR